MGYACRQLASSLTASPEGDLSLWVQQGLDKTASESSFGMTMSSDYSRMTFALSGPLCTSHMTALVQNPDDWSQAMMEKALEKHHGEVKKTGDEREEWDYGIVCHNCGKPPKADAQGMVSVSLGV